MIELRGISRNYEQRKGRVCALRDINLHITEGDFVAVTGASGSGKSTLMNIIGFLDQPSSGRYMFDGRDVSALNSAGKAQIRSRAIGFVFQSFRLLDRLTARENVELPMMYAGVERAERRLRAERLLRMVGLENRMGHLPSELSGGQSQRVAIARALANSPRLLLADEPTGNLDPKRSAEILELFGALNSEGLTIMLITHDRYAAEAAGRRIELHDGRMIYGGA